MLSVDAPQSSKRGLDDCRGGVEGGKACIGDGPVRRSGSSVGLGGGIGSERSITGGSALITTCLGLAFAARRRGVWTLGVMMTSLGGVKTTFGGSYGTSEGVALRLRGR